MAGLSSLPWCSPGTERAGQYNMQLHVLRQAVFWHKWPTYAEERSPFLIVFDTFWTPAAACAHLPSPSSLCLKCSSPRPHGSLLLSFSHCLNIISWEMTSFPIQNNTNSCQLPPTGHIVLHSLYSSPRNYIIHSFVYLPTRL